MANTAKQRKLNTRGVESSPGTVLVTGGAHRIGRAIALDLAAAGWKVAIHYRDSNEAATKLASSINSSGGGAIALEADLADENQTTELIPSVHSRLSPVTCLINNASAFEYDSIKSATHKTWSHHMDINLRAPMLLAQAFAAQLPDSRDGNIINLIDQRVWNLTPHFLSYTLSKSGLWTLTQTLALALAPRIRVNGIGPGPTLQSRRQSSEDFTRQTSSVPLGRGAAPEEICSAVRFILTSPSLTGQMIALDGGQHLGWSIPVGNQTPE